MTLSCTNEKGPPLSAKPIRLAGTWQQYSKNATHHEKITTANRGQLELTPVCYNLRWPYHANVIKILLQMSNRMV